MNHQQTYVPRYMTPVQQQHPQQQYIPTYQTPTQPQQTQQTQQAYVSQQQPQQQEQYVPRYQTQAQQAYVPQQQPQQQEQYVPRYQTQTQPQQQQAKYLPYMPTSQEPPREYRQFQQQQQQQQQQQSNQYKSYGDLDQYGNDKHTGLNVFDQGVMKRTLEKEKVDRVEAKVMQYQYNNVQQTRELIDKELQNRPIDERPETIKVEKKGIVDLNSVAARRDQETSQLKIEKKESDAAMLMGSMSVKKTDPSKLNRDMNELIKRRELEIKNIEYK
jgi:hypothetical protein